VLKANFSFATFNSPSEGPYLETYLSIIGGSTFFLKTEKNTYQSNIEVTLIFKQEGEIKKFLKYNLSSPEILDSLEERPNFIDQQRVSLPNGKYNFEISIRDMGTKNEPFDYQQDLEIFYPTDEISISGIELVESLSKTKEINMLSKSGYDLIPYTTDFFPEDINKIVFYSEIYNTDKVLGNESPFLLSCYIETSENNMLFGELKHFSRKKAKPVNILLHTFTIKDLPSGNYNLVIEVRNDKNKLIEEKRIFFQRSNPSATPIFMTNDYFNTFVDDMTKEELKKYFQCLSPISSTDEINFEENQLQASDLDMMKKYFYNFWVKRNELDPETEWNNYLIQVKTTENLFTTQLTLGCLSDRGRVFLKHGPPNTRSEFPVERQSYPYEIWHYYKIDNFSNKKFVFYNPSHASN
jgi:GWxTD domain-containing protein